MHTKGILPEGAGKTGLSGLTVFIKITYNTKEKFFREEFS